MRGKRLLHRELVELQEQTPLRTLPSGNCTALPAEGATLCFSPRRGKYALRLLKYETIIGIDIFNAQFRKNIPLSSYLKLYHQKIIPIFVERYEETLKEFCEDICLAYLKDYDIKLIRDVEVRIKQVYRRLRNWGLIAQQRKNKGLADSVEGPMNRHLLRMKYKRRRYKIK